MTRLPFRLEVPILGESGQRLPVRGGGSATARGSGRVKRVRFTVPEQARRLLRQKPPVAIAR